MVSQKTNPIELSEVELFLRYNTQYVQAVRRSFIFFFCLFFRSFFFLTTNSAVSPKTRVKIPIFLFRRNEMAREGFVVRASVLKYFRASTLSRRGETVRGKIHLVTLCNVSTVYRRKLAIAIFEGLEVLCVDR